MGTQIPMFVPKLGSIKSGQRCLSSTMGFFMEVLLWFILHIWETSRLYLKCGLFRTFGFRSIMMGFSVIQEERTSQHFEDVVQRQ